MQTSGELRFGFRSFFESKGHTFRPSAPLIPRADDRSTLLTTAGMQPLMPFFLGREQPPALLLTTVQKCFRTPDIDDVGLDGSHLTFFEMLGNFSFGQYFKEGAIELAWEFVFEHLKLDPARFWVSVFAGDPNLQLGEDEVAYRKWEEIGQPAERIVFLPASENFWPVAAVEGNWAGPCGPDTEMYYDRGEEHGCGEPDCKPSCTRCERFLEFWNLVFMEFELHADGKLTPLPKQNVDTGMGVERTAAILQNVMSVYETDGYQAIMRWIADESGVAYGDSPEATKAHRILADHGRGMTFLAADGVSPSNEGRGYVMRRIIRRAVQQAGRVGLEPPYLSRLADVVIEQMRDGYPELEEHRDEIQRILSAEEERFGQTLARGMRLFEEVTAKGGDISGDDAFRLHDTYGFPLELTQELARERGLGVNDEKFKRLMEQQRERSRAGVSVEFQLEGPKTEFVGYEKTDVLTAISALHERGDGTFEAKLHESPFYAAGGGQVSDPGVLINEEGGAEATLLEAIRLEGDDQVLVFEGSGFKEGDRVRALVPWSHRFPTMANHTATHLLHQALRDVLGDHVRQAGSAVRPDKLRFDFTHPQQLTTEERAEIERRVNEKIFENLPVRAFVTPIEEARKLGAQMLFGEKYGDEVRVIEIPGYSRELCGGTHVRWTAEIGPFVILTESSVGAGARRVEALTSGEAYAFLHGARSEADELRRELESARKEARKPKAEAAVTARHMPESRVEAAPAPLDWRGAGLAALGLGGLTFGLIEAGDLGWQHPAVALAALVGVLLLVAFIKVEAHSRAPMMPLALFRSRTFSGVNLMTLLLYMALGGAFFFVPFDLIRIQGYSAAEAGAAFLPFPLIMTVLSRWSGGLLDRFGARLPLIGGPLITALGFALLARTGVGFSYWIEFLPAMVILGLGMTVTVAPLTTTVMNAVPDVHIGVASAINNSVTDVSTLLAIAIFGAVGRDVFGAALDAELARVTLSPELANVVQAIKDTLVGAPIPSDIAGAERAMLVAAIIHSFIAAFRLVMSGTALLSLAAALTAALTIDDARRKPAS